MTPMPDRESDHGPPYELVPCTECGFEFDPDEIWDGKCYEHSTPEDCNSCPDERPCRTTCEHFKRGK